MSKKVKAALLLATLTASCMLAARSDAPTIDLTAKVAAKSAEGETAASNRATVIPAAIAAGVVSVIRSESRPAN